MNKIILFLLCAVIARVDYADSARAAHLTKARDLYAQKDYDTAYAILNSMHPKSAAIWYDLGNCAYKRNEHERALAYWRCAHEFASNNLKENILYNVDMIEKKMNRVDQASFFKRFCDAFGSIPLIVLQLLFLFPWFLLLLFIKRYKRGTRYRSLFFVLLLFMTILSGIALGFKYHIIKQRRGIIMKPHVPLFAGPDEQYYRISSLECATQVLVHEQRPLWCKISGEKNSGWVMQDSIVVV